MQTPAKFLHLKGMPKVLPFEFFSDELNQALMAKNETELMAAGMRVACLQVECGRGSPDLLEYRRKVPHHLGFDDGKTLKQRQHERYVKMVDLMIMDELKYELEDMFDELTSGAEGDDKLKSGGEGDDDPCNEGDAKKPKLAI